jgi:hypothetical protein
MDEEARKSFWRGAAGEPVPSVDSSDMKALWMLGQDVRKDHPEGGVAIGVNLVEALCKPGANIEALSYRIQMVGFVRHIFPEVMDPLMKDKLDAVLAVASEVPMKWIGGTVHHGWPFDPDDFVRRVHEAA